MRTVVNLIAMLTLTMVLTTSCAKKTTPAVTQADMAAAQATVTNEMLKEVAKKEGHVILELADEYPGAAEQLADNAAAIMPLYTLYGKPVVALEEESAGASQRLAALYNEEESAWLYANADTEQLARFVAFAGHAKNPQEFLEAYKLSGEKLLVAIEKKRLEVISGGISEEMLKAVMQAPAPVEQPEVEPVAEPPQTQTQSSKSLETLQKELQDKGLEIMAVAEAQADNR